jgi:hypothetical protein
LAALTPDARVPVANDSDHDIPGEQPEVIVAAVRQVVDAVRDSTTWSASLATPTS